MTHRKMKASGKKPLEITHRPNSDVGNKQIVVKIIEDRGIEVLNMVEAG